LNAEERKKRIKTDWIWKCDNLSSWLRKAHRL
jgi:hypothetical protein